MNENKPENRFIPCGDSMEKMDQISDEQLKEVTGGQALCRLENENMPADHIIRPLKKRTVF